MRRNVDLDADLEKELSRVMSLTKEKASAVILHALQIGLPILAEQLESSRPSGYFAGDYGVDRERMELEMASGKILQKPRRFSRPL